MEQRYCQIAVLELKGMSTKQSVKEPSRSPQRHSTQGRQGLELGRLQDTVKFRRGLATSRQQTIVDTVRKLLAKNAIPLVQHRAKYSGQAPYVTLLDWRYLCMFEFAAKGKTYSPKRQGRKICGFRLRTWFLASGLTPTIGQLAQTTVI